MDHDDAFYLSQIAKLRRCPEEFSLLDVYPELPNPIPFATATPLGEVEEDPDAPGYEGLYEVDFDVTPYLSKSFYVMPYHHRIVGEYTAARGRQEKAEAACALARWDAPTEEELAKRAALALVQRESKPEEIHADGKLTPRQQAFCAHYAKQPIATRAAVLAGFSEANACAYGSRLLRNPLVLDRIAALREAEKIEYVVARDTMHDKLEAVFFEALGERNHAAAVAALRLQAGLAGMMPRAARDSEAPKSGSTGGKKPTKAKVGARKSQGKPRSRRA